MKLLLKKVFLVALISTTVLFAGIQDVYGQTSLPDSLKNMLIYFNENTKDETFRQAINEAQVTYKTDLINDSVSKKLLVVDSLLIENRAKLDKKKLLSYAEVLVDLLQALPTQNEHRDYVTSLSNLGIVYRITGQHEKARDLFQHALAITKKTAGEEHPDYADGLNHLASLYSHIGKYDDALPLYLQALAIREKTLGKQHPDYANSLNGIANIYARKGLDKKALPLYKEALAIFKEKLGESHRFYAQSLNNLAVSLRNMGLYEEALPLYQQVLAIRKKTLGEEHADYALSLNNLAILYRNMGLYEKALPLYLQALAIRKKTLGEEDPDYAQSLNSLGILYRNMGIYEKALLLYQQALAIRKKTLGEEHPDYAASVNNLAGLYQELGQFEKALPLYNLVLTISKKTLGEEHRLYAQSLNNLAVLYQSTGRYDTALVLNLKALAIRKKILGEDHAEYSTSLHTLANLYFAKGQYEKALPVYLETLALCKKKFGEDHPAYATILSNLALLYKEMGQHEKMLPLYQQALMIRKIKLGEEHPVYAQTLKNLGLLYTILNKDSNAQTLLTDAAYSILKHLNQTYTTLSEQEKVIFLNKQSEQFSLLPSLLFNKPTSCLLALQQLYDNELAVKGMVLQDQQQVLNAIRKSGDNAAMQLFEQWHVNKTSIGKQLLLPVTQRVPYLDSLKESTTQLEQELSRRAVSFRNLQRGQVVTAKEISQKLHKDEAALEFIRFDLYNKKWTDSIIYAALLLLPGDSTAQFITLFEEKQLEHLLKLSSSAKNSFAQYASIQKLYGDTKPLSSAAQQSLYQLLWKPLEKHLTGIRTVYYAPVGLLHRIAFQALRPNANHLLIDKFELKQMLSTRSVAMPADTKQNPVFVGMWGDIDYNIQVSLPAGNTTSVPILLASDTTSSSFNFYTSDTRAIRGGDWKSLPGARKEMASLGTLFKRAGIAISIDSGTTATEEAFKALSGKSPQVLHLATHGFFLPTAKKKPETNEDAGGSTFTAQQNPMFRSGLVLAGGSHAWKGKPDIPGREDGILTAYEIAQMDLSSTSLVVLSACETALGDLEGNEGVIGLQRAFKLAGVKQLIMSLWRVPDKETTELMTLFYQNLLSGQSNREALRNAQLKMKKKYSPYYWASFVLVE